MLIYLQSCHIVKMHYSAMVLNNIVLFTLETTSYISIWT